MVQVKYYCFWMLVIVTCYYTLGSAQNKSSASQITIEELVTKLVEAKTNEERDSILSANKNAVTVELQQAMVKEGTRFTNQGDYKKALEILDLAKSVAEKLEDKVGTARVLNSIGVIHRLQGKYDLALEHYQKSLALSEESNDKSGIARTLNSIGSVHYLRGNYNQALKDYHNSLAIRQELKDKDGMARALNNIGNVYTSQNIYEKALEYFFKSLALHEELENKEGISGTLTNIGNVYSSQGNYDQALEYHIKSLSLNKELNDKYGIALTLNSIGYIYISWDNYVKAMENYQASLKLREELDDKVGIATTLNNIGNIFSLQGDNEQAMEYYKKSLKLREELKDKAGIAGVLGRIGVIYSTQGNYQKALDYAQKSLRLQEELDDKVGIAIAFRDIGYIYRSQGSYSQALKYYQISLELHEKMKHKTGIASMLSYIATIYWLEDKYDQALEYIQRSLKIYEELKSNSGIAGQLNNIGLIYRKKKDYNQALECYQKSLKIHEEINDKYGIANLLNSIGTLYHSQGNYEQALNFSKQAATLARQMGDVEILWKACVKIGVAYYNLNELDQAYYSLKEAVRIIESIRTQAAGGKQAVQFFFETKDVAYQEMVNFLIIRNNYTEALTYAELIKARVILEALSNSKINLTKAITTQEREQERNLINEMVSLNTQIYRERQRDKKDQTRLTSLDKSLEKARLDYEAFHTNLYAVHPELKVKRAEVQPVTLEEARSLMPNANTALLEFVVAEDKTHLFVLTQDKSNKSPVNLKVYTLDIKRKDLEQKVSSFRKMMAEKDLAFRKPGRELFDLLLKPAQQQLKGINTLVIVPEGILWELPFQVLQTTQGRYLWEDFTLFYTPSLTALREMIKLRNNEKDTKPATKTLLAIGNPALNKENGKQSASVLMGGPLESLPGSELLTKQLARLYGPKQSKFYIGPDAREEQVKAEAGDYRILQFATHGILNNASPMYSYLVLSQTAENSNEDGLLEAWEIMNLDLKAEMAVLAACETARGRVGAGEGVVGLTWALFVAGCPTTVVSQWKVDDTATKNLMLEFHRVLRLKYGNSKSPITKAAALRQAALKMMRTMSIPHPFYWAGFVMVGDGR
jgi:tetratricopeptide (TPR) repeat protein